MHVQCSCPHVRIGQWWWCLLHWLLGPTGRQFMIYFLRLFLYAAHYFIVCLVNHDNSLLIHAQASHIGGKKRNTLNANKQSSLMLLYWIANPNQNRINKPSDSKIISINITGYIQNALKSLVVRRIKQLQKKNGAIEIVGGSHCCMQWCSIKF